MECIEEFLISELRRFVEENCRKPKQYEMNTKNGYPQYQIYKNHFGSWKEVLEYVDLDMYETCERKIKNFLILELQRFYRENSRTPRASDMLVKDGYPSIKVYYKWFVLWNAALQEAGFRVNRFDRILLLQRGGIPNIKFVYDDINKKEFDNKLPKNTIVVFEKQLGKNTAGTFMNDCNLIMLNYEAYRKYGKDKMIEVLRHEMVHQYLCLKNIDDWECGSDAFINECKKRNVILQMKGEI